jgi:hypothetical protein
MEEKLYETYAKKIQLLITGHRQEVKNIEDAINELNGSPRYSDFGKKELVDGLRKELKELNDSYTKELKDVIKKFCNEYGVVFQEDNENHTTELANTLKIIEMCGIQLTVDLLRDAIEPLKSSYKSLKMIRNLLDNKNSNPMLPERYEPKIFELMDDYMGTNNDVEKYSNQLDQIKGLLDYPELVSAGIWGLPGMTGNEINRVREDTRYSVLRLGDNMMDVGRLYELVSNEYPRFFK